MTAHRIDILCKVVDNFGDIGVVLRLAKSISGSAPTIQLRLIVSDLASFKALEPRVDPALAFQKIRGWSVIRWDIPWKGIRDCPPEVVIEAFACGRPDWYEEILFDPGNPEIRHIINLEYLTAEPFAEEHHRMKSATRSALVKKDVFFPGFTGKTGGLIIDPEFRRALSRGQTPKQRFQVVIFSYEHDFTSIIRDLTAFNATTPLVVCIAAGKSAPSFHTAWEKAHNPFPVSELPFLGQAEWDELLIASDFAIIRGEESLARVCLAGTPFLWHAYIQEERHQLVKVRALLERMRSCFPGEPFAAFEREMLAFNDRDTDSAEGPSLEKIGIVFAVLDELRPGFKKFGEELRANGDLGEHLLSFIREIE